jgi:hypothetical protein
MGMPVSVREHEAAGRYVRADGVELFVREHREGQPVLLLHGVPTPHRGVLPQASDLRPCGSGGLAFQVEEPYPSKATRRALRGDPRRSPSFPETAWHR